MKKLWFVFILKKYTVSVLRGNPGAKMVVAGDFNDEPNSKSLSEIPEAGCPDQNKKNFKLYNMMCGKDEKGTFRYVSSNQCNSL